ncbi:glycosyltransferase [Micrococcus endophyticus]|uniref:glycosyltransferase n=1 Tax=Micrococcus endophyticus TaxID=455343 RepID=UPI00200333E5|nr:glycosyltransferase [Micrococcus endophyticus]MCK6091736.1 hypothetical protein [Micrococcus endophyticus]
MSAVSRAALARRRAAQLRSLGARLGARAADTGAAAARRARTATGRLTLPERAWAAADVVDSPAGVLPLPAARSLRRALTGARTPALDAWQPLGPRPDGAPALLLLPVGGLAAGSWPVSEAAAFAVARARRLGPLPGPPAPHTVLLTDRADHASLTAALRAAGGRRLPGLLATAADGPPSGPGRARTLAALGLADALLVPAPDRLSPALADLAARAGRAVVAAERADETWEVLAAAGRAARLAALAADPVAPDLAESASEGPGAPTVRVGVEPRRLVVAGHDLKFAGALVDRLRADGHEVRVDEWRGHARHDAERSRALAAWADAVHCEWSLGNLAWYSRHLDAPGRTTRLTSRLHLQEAATQFPGRVCHDALDAWIFVAEHVRTQVLRDTRFPLARSCVVPNAVAVPAAAPAGDDDRRFVLGLVGVLPERKGLHRALDLLAALRRAEPRFTLRIRGHHPDEVGWMADRPAAAAYYAAQLGRIRADPALAGAVTWDPHGPDMAAWYARVGVALSVSDFESFHFTLPDGAAHGCLPASLAWAGADLLYPAGWLSPDVASLAEAILAATADPATWRAAVESATRHVESRFRHEHVTERLAAEILGA